MSYAAFLDVLPTYAVPFFSLSYPVAPPKNPDSFPDSNYYNYGILDVCVVISGIAVMAILRDILRLFVFEPFGRWVLQRQLNSRKRKLANGNGKTNGAANGVNGNANGHAKLVNTRKETRVMEHSVMRFSEQGWPVIYYPLQWAFGLYIHMNLPHHNFDLTHLWIDYPHTHLAGPLKLYYLTQAAFYTHQILILNAEEHRKDHWQMMTHHIITVFLMLQSYTYHFTRVGCLMMVLMDCSDIFLPLAKMMRYLNIRQLFCDTVFGAFLVSWLITRHYLSILVIKSALFDVPNLLTFGWEPERGFYLTYGVYVMFNLCLLALQVLQIMWFATICRVAYKVLVGQGASDTRSDDEGGDDEKED